MVSMYRYVVLVLLVSVAGCAVAPEVIPKSKFHQGETIGAISLLGNKVQLSAPLAVGGDVAHFDNANGFESPPTPPKLLHQRVANGFDVDKAVEEAARKVIADNTPLAPVLIDYDAKKLRVIHQPGRLGPPDDPSRVSDYVQSLMARNNLDYLVLLVRARSPEVQNLDTLGLYSWSDAGQLQYFLVTRVFVFERGIESPIGARLMHYNQGLNMKGADLLPSRHKVEEYDLTGVPLKSFLGTAIASSLGDFLSGGNEALKEPVMDMRH